MGYTLQAQMDDLEDHVYYVPQALPEALDQQCGK